MYGIFTHRRLCLPKVPKYLPPVTKKNELHATFRVFNLGIDLGVHVCTAPFKARSRPRLGFYILGIGVSTPVIKPMSEPGQTKEPTWPYIYVLNQTQVPHVMGDTHVKETPLKN